MVQQLKLSLIDHVYHLFHIVHEQSKFFIAQGVTGRKLGEPLEMNPYIAQKLGETAKSYKEKILEEVIVELAEADFKLKTGRAGVEALERIIIKLCNR